MSPDKKTELPKPDAPGRDPAHNPTPARRDEERTGDRAEEGDEEREHTPRPSGIPQPDRDPNRRLPQYTDVPTPEVENG